jgi:hypothetical protein
MNKLLYWLFSKAVLKVYFNSQSKKSGFENMQKAFVDSNGKIHYVPNNDFDYPVNRIKEIHKRLKRIDSGLSDPELDRCFAVIKKALNGGKNPDLGMIGFVIAEMETRKDIWIHEELWFDVLALKYIREDEKPYIVDMTIHLEKVAQFRKDSQGGLYDFFYKMGLMKSIPFLQKLESDWDLYMDESIATLKAREKMYEAYLTESK